MLVVVLVLENRDYFAIRATEQNSCGTIGLFSLQRTPAHRGRVQTSEFGFNSVLTSFSMRRILSLLLLLFALTAQAQDSDADGKIMLTVILRHDQTLTLDEINDHLEKTGFRKTFPPDGVEIVSYNIVMGIGHIITLRLSPDKLREVNLAFEHGVWGAFRTEFYPTYDYLKVFYDTKKKDSESGTTSPPGKGPEDEKKPAESEKPSTPQKKQRKSSQ